MKRFIAVALIIGIIAACCVAVAEELEYFIICVPGSEVNVREYPSRRAPVVGCKFFGDKIISDGKEKNGFVHIVNLYAEAQEGWIYKGLLVEDEPIAVDLVSQVFNGRVACRKYAGGKLLRWLKDGTEVNVYAVSAVWCVTNYGYIRTDFLTLNAKVW